MQNWLSQFTADSLAAQAPQALEPMPVVTAMSGPPSNVDIAMGGMLGNMPVLPTALFGPPQPAAGWHAPMKYAPSAPSPQLDLGDITALIKRGESHGNYQALNTQSAGNTASGAYQYTDKTWNGYGGYSKALLAPKHIQDRKFQEDVLARYNKYQGNPFKIIAEHYLPAIADDPSKWQQPYRLKSGKTVYPVAQYIKEILTRSNRPDLIGALDEYLAGQH
jgi:hypothetical protein